MELASEVIAQSAAALRECAALTVRVNRLSVSYKSDGPNARFHGAVGLEAASDLWAEKVLIGKVFLECVVTYDVTCERKKSLSLVFVRWSSGATSSLQQCAVKFMNIDAQSNREDGTNAACPRADCKSAKPYLQNDSTEVLGAFT